MVVMIPVGMMMGRFIQQNQKKVMKATDARIAAMNEVTHFYYKNLY